MKHRLETEPLDGIGEIAPGTDLAEVIGQAARERTMPIGPGDVLTVAQKVISKAEGRLRDLSQVEPSERARGIARSIAKDARVVQIVLDESSEVLRAERGVLITRTHHGFVCANAGVDSSNVPGSERVSLLPADPDGSARRLREELHRQIGCRPAIVISDSFGRAWRLGQAEVAIGCAGLETLHDRRGTRDAHGDKLTATVDAIADEAAAAAGLVRDKDGREAVVVVRGLERYVTPEDGPGAITIVRPTEEDLFR